MHPRTVLLTIILSFFGLLLAAVIIPFILEDLTRLPILILLAFGTAVVFVGGIMIFSVVASNRKRNRYRRRRKTGNRGNIIETILALPMMFAVILFCAAAITIGMIGVIPAAIMDWLQSKNREFIRKSYQKQSDLPPAEITSFDQINRLAIGRRYVFEGILLDATPITLGLQDNALIEFVECYQSKGRFGGGEGWYPVSTGQGFGRRRIQQMLLRFAMNEGNDELEIHIQINNTVGVSPVAMPRSRFKQSKLPFSSTLTRVKFQSEGTMPDELQTGFQRIRRLYRDDRVRVYGQIQIPPKYQKRETRHIITQIEQLTAHPVEIKLLSPEEQAAISTTKPSVSRFGRSRYNV